MASFTSNVPPSAILKSKTTSTAGNESLRQTKDEYRKNKELEEARKAGTAPAMKDEEGRDINPHIPQFISQAPWYLGSIASGPTLKHQRPHPEREKHLSQITDWYKRGVSDKVATKYRKGACENCGSMTHKKKDCFERPRKVGARYTGDDIAPDEHLQPSLNLDFDAKRDRWNGYDPSDHKAFIEEFEKLEETRKMVKAELMKEQELLREKGLTEEADKILAEAESHDPAAMLKKAAEHDEDRYAEDADMPGVKTDMDSRTRITVRNLRIREDTAKYLINLDPESAHYDPKSRSMRNNPYAGTGKTEQEVGFAGENFVRFTGEVTDLNKAQLFAWEAKKRGIDVHQLAEPTKLAILKKEMTGRKETHEEQMKKKILEEYGGKEHLEAPPKELLLAQSENYVEYSRQGRVIKGEERAPLRSRYEEDVMVKNHTKIWGSYWCEGEWGFGCCHSTLKNSYCVGEAGKAQKSMEMKEAEEAKRLFSKEKEESKKKEEEGKTKEKSSSSSESSWSDSPSEEEKEKSVEKGSGDRKRKRRMKRSVAEKKKRTEKHKEAVSSSSSSSSDEGEEKTSRKRKEQKKLREALVKLAEEEKKGEKMLEMGERHRPYNSHYEVKQPTEHEMEAFRLRQIHSADPMSKYMGEKNKT